MYRRTSSSSSNQDFNTSTDHLTSGIKISQKPQHVRTVSSPIDVKSVHTQKHEYTPSKHQMASYQVTPVPSPHSLSRVDTHSTLLSSNCLNQLISLRNTLVQLEASYINTNVQLKAIANLLHHEIQYCNEHSTDIHKQCDICNKSVDTVWSDATIPVLISHDANQLTVKPNQSPLTRMRYMSSATQQLPTTTSPPARNTRFSFNDSVVDDKHTTKQHITDMIVLSAQQSIPQGYVLLDKTYDNTLHTYWYKQQTSRYFIAYGAHVYNLHDHTPLNTSNTSTAPVSTISAIRYQATANDMLPPKYTSLHSINAHATPNHTIPTCALNTQLPHQFISDIAMFVPTQKLPYSWFPVKYQHTIDNHDTITSSTLECVAIDNKTKLIFAYEIDVHTILHEYQYTQADDIFVKRIVAWLILCLYCHDTNVIVQSINTFITLTNDTTIDIDTRVLNAYMNILCNAMHCYISAFDIASCQSILTQFSTIVKQQSTALYADTTLNIVDTLMLYEHILIMNNKYTELLLQCIPIATQQNAIDDTDESSYLYCYSILTQLMEHVTYSKTMEPVIQHYMQHLYKSTTEAIQSIDTLLQSLSIPKHVTDSEQLPLISVLLYLCNYCKTSKYAILSINTILQSNVEYITSTPQLLYVLRRVVCVSIVTAMNNATLFTHTLQCINTLYTHYRNHTLIEFGLITEYILLPMLKSSVVSSTTKYNILACIALIVSSSTDVVHLFYNFDNHSKTWQLYNMLITTLYELSQYQYNVYNRTLTQLTVSQYATKLLAQIMIYLHDWIQCNPPIQTIHPPDTTVPQSTRSRVSGRRGTFDTDKRFSTYLFRYSEQQKYQQIDAEALKIATTVSLKHAVQYLKISLNTNNLLYEIAKFLYTHVSKLDSLQLGELLSKYEDNIFCVADYSQLRIEYMQLCSDYSDISFSDALRSFLTESGFRLPSEAQEIDRMLECFSHKYCTDNPTVFVHSNSALVLAFALVMLNTELHDIRLNNTKNKRRPMTVTEFIHNLRGTNAGHNFEKQYLIELYDNIMKHSIEWKYTVHRSEQRSTSNNVNNDNNKQYIKLVHKCVKRCISEIKQKIVSQQHYNATQHTDLALLMYTQTWLSCVVAISSCLEQLLLQTSTVIVSTLHSSTNSTAEQGSQTTLTAAINTNNTLPHMLTSMEQELITLCIDGLYCSTLIALTQKQQSLSTTDASTDTHIRLLAKLLYIEKHRYKHRSQLIYHRIATNEHIKQVWFQSLSRQSFTTPMSVCSVINDLIIHFKQSIQQGECNLMLRYYQIRLNNELILNDNKRTFVRHDRLYKQSVNDSTNNIEYEFLLFSDLLLYCENTTNHQLKSHRVLLHALTCVDVVESNALALKLINSQKSIIVVFNTAQQKTDWLTVYQSLLYSEQTLLQRQQYITNVYPADECKENSTMSDSTAVSPSHRRIESLTVQQNTRRLLTITTNNDLSLPSAYHSANNSIDESMFSDTSEHSINASTAELDLLSPKSLRRSTEDYVMLQRYTSTLKHKSNNNSISQSVDTGTLSSAHSRSTSLVIPPTTTTQQSCPLCIRVYSIFHRKARCRSCSHYCCTDCGTRRIALKNTQEQHYVCDACYGVLSGMVK